MSGFYENISTEVSVEADVADAEAAKTAAEAAQTAAESARDTALQHKNAAEVAKNAAETAETNAESAESTATTAKSSAEAARDLAETYKNAAETAKTAAETAETNATNTVASVSSDVATVAAIDSEITSVAGSLSSVNTVAGDLSGSNNIGTVAGIDTEIGTVAGISSDVTAVAGDATDIGTVATDLAGSDTIGTVSSNIANVNTVAGISSDVTAVAGDAADIGTVASNLTGDNTIGSVSSSISNVNTVANNMADVNSVADNMTDVSNAATNAGNAASSATAAAASATSASTSATNAASSESAASTSASSAASNAASASTSATQASTSATQASSSADLASSSATAAASSATAAATSESNAEDSQQAAAASESSASGSASSALSSATSATSSASSAASSASSAAASAASASNIIADLVDLDSAVSNASGSASSASTSASQAQSYRDEAESHKDDAYTYSQSAASAVAYQDLTAIAQSKSVTAVDVFVYDTRKDSDGGAWREQTQHTSWYNETLNTSTRGATKKFPAVAVVVVESNKVTIYDGDDPSMPMWMVFNGAYYNMVALGGGYQYTTVAMLNGELAVGHDDGARAGLDRVYFIKDEGIHYGNNNTNAALGSAKYKGTIEQRNDALSNVLAGLPVVISTRVNDVAVTVLPDAPIDDATGLPIPTIAVATDGGASVIKDDGTVVDITHTSSQVIENISLNDEGLLFTTRTGTANTSYFHHLFYEIPTSDVANGTGYSGSTADEFYTHSEYGSGKLPLYRSSTNGFHIDDKLSLGGSEGLQSVYRSTSVGVALYNATTTTHNTGWMVGDIKLATLSDTDGTSLAGSQVVTNNTFDSDINGWTDASTGAGSIAYDNGTLKLIAANYPTDRGRAAQTISVVSGKTYMVSFEVTSSRAVYHQATGGWNKSANYTTGTHSYVVTPTTNSVVLNFEPIGGGSASSASNIDNVYVRVAVPDRSFNKNGLIVNGTITRSAVATGAELVGYDFGSANSNYLKIPYQSSLASLGTSWTFITWVERHQTNGWDFLISISGPNSTHGAGIKFDSNQTLKVAPHNGYNHSTAASSASDAFGFDLDWQMIAITCDGSTTSFYRNGKLSSFAAKAPSLSLPDSTYYWAIGSEAEHSTGGPLDGRDKAMALLRLSATVATAEQIAKIYNDEKHLFQENAACTLYGTSDDVNALAYDEDAELLHVGTSGGRSVFKGLQRVDNTTDAVGVAISASNDLVVEE